MFFNFIILILFLLLVELLSKDIEIFVPIIDISPLLPSVNEYHYSSADKDRIIQEIGLAIEKLGFFHVINHGISKVLIDEVIKEMKYFFNSPLSIKNSVRRSFNNSRGYANDEYTKQLIDIKEIFDMGHTPHRELPCDASENSVLDGYNQWPQGDEFLKFRDTTENYYDECTKLSNILMEAIFHYLSSSCLIENNEKVISEKIGNAFSEHTSLMRLNYYPVLRNQEMSNDGDTIYLKQFGVSRHTDAGAITLLYQGGSGLQVYSGSKEDFGDGQWIDVDVIENGFTVNIGDMLQVWSNKRFKAPEHRVLASDMNERFSIPYFYNPSYDAEITPIVCNDDKKVYYRDINWGYFRRRRFEGDYADFGKEIQIEDYEI